MTVSFLCFLAGAVFAVAAASHIEVTRDDEMSVRGEFVVRLVLVVGAALFWRVV